jgi:hypothetical protein
MVLVRRGTAGVQSSEIQLALEYFNGLQAAGDLAWNDGFWPVSALRTAI